MGDTTFSRWRRRTAVIHNHRLAPCALRSLSLRPERYEPSKDVTLVTIHDQDGPSMFERSLTQLGLSCVVLKPARPFIRNAGDPKHLWRLAHKIELMDEFLGTCRSRYVLYCDAFDCCLMRPPGWICRLAKKHIGPSLFSSTRWPGDSTLFAQSHHPGTYLCSGVYVGETGFLRELMSEAARLVRLGFLNTHLDQPYFCHMEEVLHPSVGLDAAQRLAFRSRG